MKIIAESFKREFEKEHKESFICSPGFLKDVDGVLPLNVDQLKKKLYTCKSSYNKGKLLEYYIDGEEVLEITAKYKNHNKKFKANKTTLDFFKPLTQAVEWFIQKCDNKDLIKELIVLQKEFKDSNFSYEEGKILQGFLAEN